MSNKKSPLGWLVLALVCGAVLAANSGLPVIGTWVRSALHVPQKGLATLAYPLRRGRELFVSHGVLVRQNRELRRRASDLQRQLILEREKNVALAQQANLKLQAFPAATKITGATVIARDPANPFHTAMIDRGSAAGIRIKDVVVAPAGIIGQVIKADPSQSVVLLITDTSSSVSVLEQRTRVPGVCKGQASDTLLGVYFRKDSGVKVGDIILSSGLGGIFPQGIALGRIDRIKLDEASLTVTAYVIPSALSASLEKVIVIRRRADAQTLTRAALVCPAS